MRCEACEHENVEGARFCAKCGIQLPPEERGEDPLVGQIIGGRYRITGIIGEGGMGIVYSGEQQMGSTVRKVAVKTLHAHLSKDPSVLARFHRECGTVSELEHENTIKFYDFGATPDGTLYIAMEFVKGKPLSSVVEHDGAQPPARVVHIMRQICGALDEAHEKGIVHRDLKPENVILTKRAGEDDFVKLLDFGIAARSESADAKKLEKLTQQGMVLGTPPYMSPEQFTGSKLDLRSDIYSLGVMAYELLTGRLPFDADTPWEWATKHMTAQPWPFETSAPQSRIPGGMRQAILRALSKDREDRQKSAKEFISELTAGMATPVPGVQGVVGPGTSLPTTNMEAVDPLGNAAVGSPRPSTGSNPQKTQLGTPVAAVFDPGPQQPYVAPQAQPYQPAANYQPVPNYQPTPSGKSGAGLIIGVVGIGGLLLVGLGTGAFFYLKKSPGTDSTATVATIDIGPTNPTGTGTGNAGNGTATTIAPIDTVPTAPTATGGEPDAGTTGKTVDAGKPKDPSTRPSANPTGQPTQPAGDPCAQCVSAASGNILAAASFARKCTDPSGKQRCSNAVRLRGNEAAKRAAFNGNCREVDNIVNAGSAAGVTITKPACTPKQP